MISVLVALCACEETQEYAPDSIEVSSETLSFDHKGGSLPVVITSSGDWRISGKCDWAAPSAFEGKSGDEVVFTVDPNNTDSSLETTFKVFTGSAVATVKVISEIDSYLVLEGDVPSVETKGGTVKVEVRTNIQELDCTFSEGASEWISFDKRLDAFGKTYLTFNVSENETYKDRMASVTVTGSGATLGFDINQVQLDYLSLDEESYAFEDLEEKDVEVTVTSNVDFSVVPADDWITIKDEGTASEKDENGLSTRTVVLHLNKGTGTRSSVVSFQNESSEEMASLSIWQQNPNPKYAEFEDQDLADAIAAKGWIIERSDGYELSELGLTGTSLVIESTGWGALSVDVIAGLGVFPELKELTLNRNYTVTVDLSDCKKIETLVLNDSNYLQEVRIGSNPLSQFNLNGYLSKETFTLSGDNITTVNMNCSDSYIMYYETCKAIDVTGCPKLQTLDAVREYAYQDWWTGSMTTYCSLKTIYMTSAQQASVDLKTCEHASVVVK